MISFIRKQQFCWTLNAKKVTKTVLDSDETSMKKKTNLQSDNQIPYVLEIRNWVNYENYVHYKSDQVPMCDSTNLVCVMVVTLLGYNIS